MLGKDPNPTQPHSNLLVFYPIIKNKVYKYKDKYRVIVNYKKNSEFYINLQY